MARSQMKIGNCELCGKTLIVELDEEFFCNSWGCFKLNILNVDGEEGYIIKGKEKLKEYEK